MTTQDLCEEIGVSKAGDGSFQFLPAIIYTSDCVLKGKIQSQVPGSLADVLNFRSTTAFSESMDAFLPLSGVEALYPGGSSEGMQSTYVRKDNILFAAQTKAEMVRCAKRGKPRSDERDDYVVVAACVPSHVLVGRLAGHSWRTLAHSLGSQQRFLSLSEVRVSSHSAEGETKYALAAINSSRVLHITQLSQEGERIPGPLTVDGILAELLGLKYDRDGDNRPVTK